MSWSRSWKFCCLLLVLAVVLAGCAPIVQEGGERSTRRDKTGKGAAIGAGAGALAALALGERELDEILVGAAIGAGVGAGVGTYMDRQEEKLAQIPGTSVERVDQDLLLVRFESDILFDVDSAVLDAASRTSIEQAATVFNEYDKTAIIVQGHTDSTGSEEHNEALSERRAKAVLNYLVGLGVDSARMVAVGYGEAHPVADNGTASGRQLNRRVDLLLKAKAK
jgi:outer membrane protein OmpA-like peptidoglycan-associated protein